MAAGSRGLVATIAMNNGVRFNESDVRKLKPEQQAQIASQLGTPVRGRRPKQGGQVALGEGPKVARFSQRVRIHFIVYKRGEQWDADNIETKGIVDALVKNHILRNDRIKEVPIITKQGESCDTIEEERTVVNIYEA